MSGYEPNEETNLIEVQDLKKYFVSEKNFFGKTKQYTKAVDGVSFTIKKGETFGLVGESGCGKSTLGRTITQLYEATDGKVLFAGQELNGLSSKALQPYRKRMQSIFQDPYSALNPNMTVADIIAEPIDIHMKLSRHERQEKVAGILEKVGLKREDMSKFPYEFSGGQRQRIGIARALSVQPEFILCDEAISALDVSIQAQVINLLEDLQDEFGLTYLFVAHDLSMVRHISDRVAVMYLGKIVEISPSDELYLRPLHPYTKDLLAAIPIPDPKRAQDFANNEVRGELPNALSIPSGCRFRSRCQFATDLCAQDEPALREVSEGHLVACHYAEKIVAEAAK